MTSFNSQFEYDSDISAVETHHQEILDKDLKVVIDDMDSNLNSLQKEMDVLLASQSSIIEASKSNQNKIILMNKEVDSLKKQIDYYKSTIAVQNSSLKNLNQISEELTTSSEKEKQLISKDNPTSRLSIMFGSFEKAMQEKKDRREILSLFSQLKKDLLELFDEKAFAYQSVAEKNRILEELNVKLEVQVKKHEEEHKKGKFCIHCHQTFTTINNDEKSCTYHSGKLKYYSCRGCGADEYYTCCNKCSICSKGCKQTRHISEG